MDINITEFITIKNITMSSIFNGFESHTNATQAVDVHPLKGNSALCFLSKSSLCGYLLEHTGLYLRSFLILLCFVFLLNDVLSN